MRYVEIKNQLRGKLYFTPEELAEYTGLKPESAKVLCSRYAKKGIFIKLKKGFYILQDRWENLSNEDFFKIANILQVPSYISFMTALSFYELTTQVQRDYFESVSLKRSLTLNIEGIRFNFYKIKKEYYFGFFRKGDFFIASKEKAFIDAFYLYSFGKYRLDIDSIDIEKLDKEKIREILKGYPEKTKEVIKRLCGI